MKVFNKVIAVSALMLSITGCQQIGQTTSGLDYSTGVNVTPAQLSTLADNKSTKADVVRLVGEPGNKSEVGGNEIWSYGYTYIPGVPFTGKKNVSETTVFEFDKKGILLKHYKTNSNAQASNALLKAAGM